MNRKTFLTFAASLAICTNASATDWELNWLRGGSECWSGWRVTVDGPVAVFGGPIGPRGTYYSNSCFAEAALGGRATVTIDPYSKVIVLWFKPPAPTFCPLYYDPVCGLQLTAGPLADGDWLFHFDSYTNPVMIPFHIDAPPDTLTLLTPDSNEFVPAQSLYEITWQDSRSEGSCDGDYILYYSTDNGKTWLTVDTNPVSQRCSYDWTVPDANSQECLIRIVDADMPDVNDVTDGPFSIYECEGPIEGDLDR